MAVDRRDQELFDECIADAITLGEKHINTSFVDREVERTTTEEWSLALVLFKLRSEGI